MFLFIKIREKKIVKFTVKFTWLAQIRDRLYSKYRDFFVNYRIVFSVHGRTPMPITAVSEHNTITKLNFHVSVRTAAFRTIIIINYYNRDPNVLQLEWRRRRVQGTCDDLNARRKNNSVHGSIVLRRTRYIPHTRPKIKHFICLIACRII